MIIGGLLSVVDCQLFVEHALVFTTRPLLNFRQNVTSVILLVIIRLHRVLLQSLIEAFLGRSITRSALLSPTM